MKICNTCENYICKGRVIKQGNSWVASFFKNKRYYYLGSYSTKSLAEEAREHFISINCDIELFKKSNYYAVLKFAFSNILY